MIFNERKSHADFADSADKILDRYKKNLHNLHNLREKIMLFVNRKRKLSYITYMV